MKSFKNFLRKIDIFGVPFNFKYKTRDKYSTPIGGFILLLFIFAALTFGIYYMIPFINRNNLSIIYYTMNIPKTEKINLSQSKAAFSIGLDCEDKTTLKANDVFKLQSTYILYIKNMTGHYNKDKTPLPSHLCKYEDYYNNYNTSFDYLGLKKYHCLDIYDHNIEGIYSDQIFSYYEFSLTARDKTDDVEEYLKYNDCKLQIFYTDITIDLSNYKEPIKPFLNSFFIQLNPTLFIKRNVFFMNQYLYDDDEILAVFNEEQKPKQIKTLFSRYEEYSLYVGLNRAQTSPSNDKDYAKIYIRADTKKTEIRRTYQKLTEFYADASSLLIAVYDFLNIIISLMSTFYAEQSIIKKLFIFKDMDDKYYHFSQNAEKIHELVTLSAENNTIERHESSKRKFRNARNFLSLRSSSSRKDIKNMETIDKEENKENKEIGEKKESKENIEIVDIKPKTKEFSFNICETIGILICPCCISGQLKTKQELSEKENKILYNKLNIILYVRNMILLDIMNKTILDEKKRDIINFLSKPILSTKQNIYERRGTFYQNYVENDFDKFYKSYSELIKKNNKKEKEKRLIIYSQEQLKELV